MKYNPGLHHRRSIRLKGYDYSRAGACFLTICAHHRECIFGDAVKNKMVPNAAGEAAVRCWKAIPSHFPRVRLDAFVVMPNHVHGILVMMNADNAVGAKNLSPLQHPATTPKSNKKNRPRGTSKTLGSVVRGFKIGVTKWMRENTAIYEIWQRNYWEHIVRSETEMDHIREYIVTNPAKWEMDRLNPHWNGHSGDRRGEKSFAPRLLLKENSLQKPNRKRLLVGTNGIKSCIPLNPY